MISTVTNATISTVTSDAIAGSLALIIILLLLALLIQKEVAANSADEQSRKLSRTLTLGIAPLLMVFFLILVTQVAAALR